MSIQIETFFDKKTSTLTYILWDKDSKDSVIIDPVLDYDQSSSSLSLISVRKLTKFVKENELKLHLILETHAHADHLSGSQELKKIFPGAKVGIGSEITLVQETFKKVLNFGDGFSPDGKQFDFLISENETLHAGTLSLEPIHNPGHTPACYSYKTQNIVFTGDALFMPDFGVARCDFPQGSAETLFDSVTRKLYQLDDDTRVFTGHDYQPNGRELKWETTIGESKKSNIHINSNTTRESFVDFRTKRDQTLPTPRLLIPSIQINIRGGHLPPPEDNGAFYLKSPLIKNFDL